MQLDGIHLAIDAKDSNTDTPSEFKLEGFSLSASTAPEMKKTKLYFFKGEIYRVSSRVMVEDSNHYIDELKNYFCHQNPFFVWPSPFPTVKCLEVISRKVKYEISTDLKTDVLCNRKYFLFLKLIFSVFIFP